MWYPNRVGESACCRDRWKLVLERQVAFVYLQFCVGWLFLIGHEAYSLYERQPTANSEMPKAAADVAYSGSS